LKYFQCIEKCVQEGSLDYGYRIVARIAKYLYAVIGRSSNYEMVTFSIMRWS